jgi:type IV secretory pathway TraG/TraD family ATPase VirD4
MSEIYVGKIKNLGKLGEDVMRCKSAWLSKELMQAISIAQTVIKPKERYDFWIESATNLLAGIILYLNQRHGDLYYLDLEKVREFVQQAKEKEKDPYLLELSELLKKDHPAYQMFIVLALSAKETRQGTISTLLRILDEQQEQHEKLEKQRECFGFQY